MPPPSSKFSGVTTGTKADELARIERSPAYVSALRRALLQRVADRLGVARLLSEDVDVDRARKLAVCCWVLYVVRRQEYWAHRLCSDDCPHWHHQAEVWITMAAPTITPLPPLVFGVAVTGGEPQRQPQQQQPEDRHSVTSSATTAALPPAALPRSRPVQPPEGATRA
jgi:hypothetical protein